MNVFINNTRTFEKYQTYPFHHDLMLANGCMAACYDDQELVDRPAVGDTVALYANDVGIVAFGIATNVTAYLDDERVGGDPTKIRKLKNFRLISFPIHSKEYKTSNTQTLSQVRVGQEDFLKLLHERAIPPKDSTIFD